MASLADRLRSRAVGTIRRDGRLTVTVLTPHMRPDRDDRPSEEHPDFSVREIEEIKRRVKARCKRRMRRRFGYLMGHRQIKGSYRRDLLALSARGTTGRTRSAARCQARGRTSRPAATRIRGSRRSRRTSSSSQGRDGPGLADSDLPPSHRPVPSRVPGHQSKRAGGLPSPPRPRSACKGEAS